MERLIDKLSRPKTVMILAGLSIGYAVVLFGLGPYSEIQRAYQGRKLLEESFGYGKTDVATQLAAFGDHYQQLYLKFQLFDYVNAILMALALAAILSFTLTSLLPKNSPMRLISLLPLVAGIADLIENTGLIHLTLKFPEISSMVVSVASFATQLKLSVDIFCMILAVLTLIAAGCRKLRY
ncbi:MAG: hypothetical protein IPL01_20665 [Acidobacteria bacterium]|nr:hypothetical protein [Acidobacteriota bacterium]